MDKQFIPYKLALKLKELGFNEVCLGVYYTKDGFVRLKQESEVGDAPLWQQAFDWFRVNHGHYSNIVPNPTRYIEHQNCDWLFGYNIINSDNPMFDLRYKTYEEARLKCLEKLIELCQEQKEEVEQKK